MSQALPLITRQGDRIAIVTGYARHLLVRLRLFMAFQPLI